MFLSSNKVSSVESLIVDFAIKVGGDHRTFRLRIINLDPPLLFSSK